MEEYEQPPGVPLSDLKVSDFVAIETCLEQHTQIFVARITRIFGANRQLEVNAYQVPTSQRYGPWNRRTWEVRTDKSDVLTHIVVPDTELLCKVELIEGALTEESLERLAHLGVNVGQMPHRDKAIPSRVL